jgi:hypothetical protein
MVAENLNPFLEGFLKIEFDFTNQAVGEDANSSGPLWLASSPTIISDLDYSLYNF